MILRDVVITLIVGCGSALFVRFAMAAVLNAVRSLLEEAVRLVAVAALLPDLLISSAARRRSEVPPRWVYEYGAVVAGVARVALILLRQIYRGLTSAARSAPPLGVGALGAGVYVLLRFIA